MPEAGIESRIELGNILVTTDFSEASSRTYEYAASFARRYDSNLYVAHVLNTAAYVTDRLQSVDSSVLDDARRSLGARLRDLARDLTRQGVPTATLLGEGSIEKTVEDIVKEQKIDLVIAGTHDAKLLDRLILGAEQIVRTVVCPVLTIGPQVMRHPNKEIEFKHILYATSLLPKSAHALHFALSFAEEYHARLSFMHVILADDLSPADVDEPSEYCAKAMRRLVPRAVDHWCQPAFVLEHGSPVSVIVKYAKENAVDLIVLGAKGGSHLASHLVRGTVDNVVNVAECPVLTVRRD